MRNGLAYKLVIIELCLCLLGGFNAISCSNKHLALLWIYD
jgi:hypothetical protein